MAIIITGVTRCDMSDEWVDESQYEISGVQLAEEVIKTGCCRKSRLNALSKVHQFYPHVRTLFIYIDFNTVATIQLIIMSLHTAL